LDAVKAGLAVKRGGLVVRRRSVGREALPAEIRTSRNICSKVYKANMIFEISLIDGIDFLESFLMHHRTPRKIRMY
jgi:hypothetical protein